MFYKTILPHPALRPFVKCYWVLETDNTFSKTTERVLPDGCFEILFYRNSNAFTNQGSETPNQTTEVIGQITKFLQLTTYSNISLIGVRFYPWGLQNWLRFPLHDITNTSLNLSDIMGEASNELTNKILHSNTAFEAINYIEQFLLKYQLNQHNQVVVDLAQQITASKGATKVTALIKDSKYSQRYISKLFNHHIGISPKLFSRIVRLQNTITILNSSSKQQLTELAYSSDYFDQAHFVKDFKELVGLSPKAYLKEKHLLSDYLTLK